VATPTDVASSFVDAGDSAPALLDTPEGDLPWEDAHTEDTPSTDIPPLEVIDDAVDVERIGDTYALVAEAHQGTKLYVSETPTDWHYLGFLTQNSGGDYDAFGQVTPHLVLKGGDAVALFVGGASDVCWCKNRVAVYFPQDDVAGCNACLGDLFSCQQACEGNDSTYGFCGAPGSTDPGACCTCCDGWDC